MAGGEGPLRRRTAKSVEAAAAAGPQAQLRRCSTTKRKASGKEAASGRTPRPRASGSKTKEETPAALAEAEKAAAGVKQKRRLPAKDVRWILAQKTRAPPETYKALKRSNPELVPRPEEEGDEDLVALYIVARAFYDLQEKIPKIQARVRSELNEKGYVEVDEYWFKRKAETQAVIDQEWPAIRAMMEELTVSGGGGNECESDSDEEEGEDE